MNILPSSISEELWLLFFMPFLREDLAAIAGGYLISESGAPYWSVFTLLFAGIMASDLSIYLLGTLAGRSKRVQGFLHKRGVERISNWLSRHPVPAMLIARIVPGTIFLIYAGLGMLRTRLALFVPLTAITAAAYLFIVLWVVIRFDESVLSNYGYWAWGVFIAAILLVSFIVYRKPHWAFLMRVSQNPKAELHLQDRVRARARRALSGMPTLNDLKTHIGLAERIPSKIFYVPMALNWIGLGIVYRGLALPTITNPRIEVGGLWGESKKVYLDMVSGGQRKWLARYATMVVNGGDTDFENAVALLQATGITFPCVVKPDIGWQGHGVQLLHSEAQLKKYIAAFPVGATMMLQEAVPWEGEAGVFYVRMPNEEKGRVVSMTFRYFPHVVGDGLHTVRDLIIADERASWKADLHLGLEERHGGVSDDVLNAIPADGEIVRLAFIGSIRVGGIYRDADHEITPELSARFDDISRSMPDFYYGRFDVRFASVEKLRAGEDFSIIEVNGAGSEAISAWDPEVPVRKVYARLLEHQRLMFKIGALNRKSGWRSASIRDVLRAARNQTKLINRYPPSS